MTTTTARFDPRTYGAYMDGTRDDSLAFIITDLQAQAGPPGSVIDLAGVCSLQRPFTMTTPIECAPGARIKATATVTYQGVVTAWEAQSTVFSGTAPVLNGGYAVSGGIGGAASGDLSGNYPGPLTIVAGAVTTGKLAAGAANGAALGADVVTTAKGLVKLSESLLVAPQSNFLLTQAGGFFPGAGYRNLLIRLIGRGDAAAVAENVTANFNNDNGAHYNYLYIQGVGAAVTATDGANQGAMFVGAVAAASAPAGACGCIELWLPAYVLTTFNKVVRAKGGLTNAASASGHVLYDVYGEWQSAAAISTINLTIAAGNFVAGSIVEVYGEP